MIRFSVTLIFLLLLLSVAASSQIVKGDKGYDDYINDYPFLEDRHKLYTYETEFVIPDGYRIKTDNLSSYQKWISRLPLWRKGIPVSALGKGIFIKVGEFSRRVQLPWRTAHFIDYLIPVQLAAEYLRLNRNIHKLELMPRQGESLTYMKWLKNVVVKDRLGNLAYVPSKKREDTEIEFNKFIDIVAFNMNYQALAENCDTLEEKEVSPGDIWITRDEKGRQGKVYVILNVLENNEGDKLYAVGTGCPEACDFYIPLFNGDEDNPWITLEEIKGLGTEYPLKGFYRLKM
ncbi:MAG: DUF4846 domain-containing protein [Candidatus Zixiibacteriota bacterium]